MDLFFHVFHYLLSEKSDKTVVYKVIDLLHYVELKCGR